MKQILFILTVSLILTACRHTTWVRYNKGLKDTETFTRYPKRSTSYTKKGKIVYTDSITEQLVKIQKYKRKVTCVGFNEKRDILITYDSTGKRISRENLLRVKVKEGQDIKTKF